MVLIAAPLAVIGNVIRITSVIIAGEAFGKKAGLFVHDWFGFVTFLVAIVVVMLLGYVLREPEKELDEGEKICAASQDGPDLSAEKTV